MSASREKKQRIEERAKTALSPAKKKQQHKERNRKIITGVVSGAILLAIVAIILAGTGVFTNMTANSTALRIGDVDIPVYEYNYHYWSNVDQTAYTYEQYGLLSYIGLDTSSPLKDQPCAFVDGISWEEYFSAQTDSLIQLIVAQSEEAKKIGLSLAEEDISYIDSYLENMSSYAAYDDMSVDKFLASYFGSGMTADRLRSVLERHLLSDRYRSYLYDGYVRTDEDIENYYLSRLDDYDQVDYHAYTFDGNLTAGEDGENPTDEEKQAYSDEQKALAGKMLAEVTTGEAFKALADKYAPAEDETAGDEDAGDGTEDEAAADEEPSDDTIHKNTVSSDLSDAMKEYLFNADRKAGDKQIVEVEGNFTVVLFLGRHRELTNDVNVRHLLVSIDTEAEDQDSEKAARLAEAEALLRQWEEGDATEDSFIALVKEHTDDTGSAETGGLIENVNVGANLVQPFIDWGVDLSRKPGDTGIVESTYGYHIMYFKETLRPYWQSKAESDMNDAEYEEAATALTDKMPISEKSGMKNTKKR